MRDAGSRGASLARVVSGRAIDNIGTALLLRHARVGRTCTVAIEITAGDYRATR